jgi:hypothetical protein
MESPQQELPCIHSTAGALLEARSESIASKSVFVSPSAVADRPQYLRKSRLETFILTSPFSCLTFNCVSTCLFFFSTGR